MSCNHKCETTKVGLKYDDGKLMYDLLPPKAIEEVVKVLTYGAKKYAPNNWKKVDEWRSRYIAALMRHFEKYRQGEMINVETHEGKPHEQYHLANVICCAIFLLEQELNFEKNDNKEKN